MNEYDSNRISDLVKKIGYKKTESLESADCYILNTCHIREKATEKVYHDIGRLKKKYRNKKKPIVLITGCVAQAENDEMLKREKYIDAVVGPQSYHNIPEILKGIINKKTKINSTEFDVIEKFDKLNTLENSESKVSSYITIQEGCDKFCNFCVVPYTRGTEYSRSLKEIIHEAQSLVSNGTKEITLLGQNVNAYNFKYSKKSFRLSDLIRELDKIKNLKRIRYTTSHPNDMSPDLIECYKDIKKLMPFLHLPVQSGSNNILKKMNRKYTREYYLSIVNKIREVSKNIEFSSDFIIGYPGETERDFLDTIDLIKKVNFINSYSFIYNRRPGTPAASLGSIKNDEQKKRLIIIQNLLQEIQINKNKNSVGKIKEVLVENKLKNQTKYFGRTQELTPVIFDANKEDVGKVIDVEIKKYNRNTLFGSKITSKKEAAA
ncbi:MAG: tRNA (N6-isopentenyl adenosine(37)-C2)-methylthiotransferase MiaB [Candidatus Pelagibacter sp. TMED165]|nr:MAG: tRNA (N6-isopentenyl adenosine(37)-C2)-methylthiotransferase MiaB [Candidatus Pelagibacter sp. TMED165]